MAAVIKGPLRQSMNMSRSRNKGDDLRCKILLCSFLRAGGWAEEQLVSGWCIGRTNRQNLDSFRRAMNAKA
eukprot:362268-Chlamydomonas_euryale.AAC.3